MDISQYRTADSVKQIYREAEALSLLTHKNIIDLYHAFVLETQFVLIMEYAAGGELKGFVRERKGISELEAQIIMKQISSAVYYCHSKGIVH